MHLPSDYRPRSYRIRRLHNAYTLTPELVRAQVESIARILSSFSRSLLLTTTYMEFDRFDSRFDNHANCAMCQMYGDWCTHSNSCTCCSVFFVAHLTFSIEQISTIRVRNKNSPYYQIDAFKARRKNSSKLRMNTKNDNN